MEQVIKAASIKDIIQPTEEIKCDAVLEQHLHDCIIAGDFEMLRAEQQAVADVLDRTKAKRERLQKTYERMKLANDRMRQAEGIIYSKEDLSYIDEQITIVTRNFAYYDARINVIDSILEDANETAQDLSL